MVNVLLTTHGFLCKGMEDTLKIFMNNEKNITSIPFYTDDIKYNADEELNNYIANIKPDEIYLIITDILWGSVNQKVMVLTSTLANVHVVTGMNLSVVLELIMMKEEEINLKTIQNKMEVCKDSIVYLNTYEINFNDADE